jgi:hypothetical protein
MGVNILLNYSNNPTNILTMASAEDDGKEVVDFKSVKIPSTNNVLCIFNGRNLFNQKYSSFYRSSWDSFNVSKETWNYLIKLIIPRKGTRFNKLKRMKNKMNEKKSIIYKSQA